jgi:hypothetical protein
LENPGFLEKSSQPDMTTARRFSRPALEELGKVKIIGVRAGTEHRYTGVWVVVVEGRVFVRSWNDKPTGWYRAFQAEPLGSIQLAGREIAIRARRLRGERLRDAVTRAYAGKYDTKASEKWVRGFADPHRSATTLELLPKRPKKLTIGVSPSESKNRNPARQKG